MTTQINKIAIMTRPILRTEAKTIFSGRSSVTVQPQAFTGLVRVTQLRSSAEFSKRDADL